MTPATSGQLLNAQGLPVQLLLLEAVSQAIADAGYSDRPFERERTAAILGVGGGGMPLSVAYGFRGVPGPRAASRSPAPWRSLSCC